METIRIALTSRHTTRLGFGCSGIVGGLERRRSLALLETAFDEGIRHFDVAPMYGFGTAEEVLGEFLRRHPGAVTVTTKFGLPPDRRHPLIRLAYAFGRRVRRIAKAAGSAKAGTNTNDAKPLRKLPFTAEQAARSLERSLQRLHLDSVDLFLLHEASANDLTDSGLLAFLQQQVQAGRVRSFGVGSAPPLLPGLLRERPEYCGVVQSNWSAGDHPMNESRRFRITHRALQGNWQAAYNELLHCDEKRNAWSEQVGVDLGDRAVWPTLLLRAALAVNTGTMALFSTRSRSRIAQNVAAAHDAQLTLPAIRLHELLHADQQAFQTDEGMADSPHMSLTSGIGML